MGQLKDLLAAQPKSFQDSFKYSLRLLLLIVFVLGFLLGRFSNG